MPFLAGVAQMAHGIARMIYAVETKSARMQMYTQIKVIDQVRSVSTEEVNMNTYKIILLNRIELDSEDLSF